VKIMSFIKEFRVSCSASWNWQTRPNCSRKD
jgi:hypothetical protein